MTILFYIQKKTTKKTEALGVSGQVVGTHSTLLSPFQKGENNLPLPI